MSRPDAAPDGYGDVIRADTADAGALSQVIAEAFLDLPPSWWLIADQAVRRQIFPEYFRIFVEAALADGIVQTIPDRTAVGIWLPSGTGEPSSADDSSADDSPDAGEQDDYVARLTAVTQPWTSRFLAFDSAIESRHPVRPAHHHLAFLAVQPSHQGRGIGTALLLAHHRFLDREASLPAYLEASTPRSREFYRRHGYGDLGPPNYLPDGGPPMYPMWRDPGQ